MAEYNLLCWTHIPWKWVNS